MTKIYFNGASVKFQPRDIWVGVYWDRVGHHLEYGVEKRYHLERWATLSVYLCILPMLPIHLRFSWVSRSFDWTPDNA